MSSESRAVSLSGLRRSFGSVEAVAGVDLAVSRGEVVALLGPNGAGKTTTIAMLLGLLRPDAGQVRIYGQEPKRAIADGLVGSVLQYADLLDGVTVAELVTAVASLYPAPRTVPNVLAAAGISDLGPRRTNKPSGGQQQRVRFACALVGDPDLLVLDEPTAGMDVAARQVFWEAIRAFAGTGRTVMFSTHYLEEADEIADRIVVIARGVVVANGPVIAIRAAAASRVVRATLPAPVSGDLLRLPGVQKAEVHGMTVTLHCNDSDVAVRALLMTYQDARDLEVRPAALSDAIVALTGDAEQPVAEPRPNAASTGATR